MNDQSNSGTPPATEQANPQDSAGNPLDEPHLTSVGHGLPPREKWFLRDAESAEETPRLFRPVTGGRKLAIAALRAAATDIVEKTLPKTADSLFFALRPLIAKYAEDLFDYSAYFRLQHRGQGKPKTYQNWLRSRCAPAVVDDACGYMMSQFPAMLGLLIEQIPERQSPETFRALHKLWGAWNPLSQDRFCEELRNYLSVRLKTQNCARWMATSSERVAQAAAPRKPQGRPKAVPIYADKVTGLRGEQSQGTFARSLRISIDVLQRAEQGLATDKTIGKICSYSGRTSSSLSKQTGKASRGVAGPRHTTLKPDDLKKNKPQKAVKT